MSDSNRVQLAIIREATLGTTPGSPRMRRWLYTGETLKGEPKFQSSNAIRPDRMNADPFQVNTDASGPINSEVYYPDDLGPQSEALRSAFFNPWTVQTFRDNDGTGASVITNVAAAGQVVTVTNTGVGFVVGQFVRFTGFTNAANISATGFRCSTASSTVPAFTGSGLVNEAAPAAAARMKVVGFQGVAGDITAAATSLGSTALDFTTLSLTGGQWLKIDSTTTVNGYATAANNAYVRVDPTRTITATFLPLDNLPAGWGVDAGAAKTITVYYGDTIKNGTTMTGLSIERGYLSQTTPTYIVTRGMVNNTKEWTFQTEKEITTVDNFLGLTVAQSTVALSGTPDAASTKGTMTGNVSVGTISIGGTAAASPNWASDLKITLNNNLRLKTALGNLGGVDIGTGEAAVSGSVSTYFGSNAYLATLLAGTPGMLYTRAVKNNQGLIWTLPRLTFTAGSPNAQAKNQNVMLPLSFMSSIDTSTNAHMMMDRFEFVN